MYGFQNKTQHLILVIDCGGTLTSPDVKNSSKSCPLSFGCIAGACSTMGNNYNLHIIDVCNKIPSYNKKVQTS